MNEYLKKLKLIDHLETKFDIKKEIFVNMLAENVIKENFHNFLLSSSKKKFKGVVTLEKFKIKRRNIFFEISPNLAYAKGTFDQEKDTLIIKTEIIGTHPLMIPVLLFLLFGYLYFIVLIFFSNSLDNVSILSALSFIIILAIIMIGLPYLLLRRDVKRLKLELNNELMKIKKDYNEGN